MQQPIHILGRSVCATFLVDPCAQDATYTVRSLRSKVAQMPRARAQAIIEARSDVSSAVRSLMLQREWETAIEVMVLEQTDRFTDERVLDFTLPASVEAAEFPKSTWSPLHIAALLLAGGVYLIGLRWLAMGATRTRSKP